MRNLEQMCFLIKGIFPITQSKLPPTNHSLGQNTVPLGNKRPFASQLSIPSILNSLTFLIP